MSWPRRYRGSREQWEADTPHVSMNDAITQTEQILADAEVDADASSRALQQVCEQLGINAPANLTLGVAVQEALGIRHFSAEEVENGTAWRLVVVERG